VSTNPLISPALSITVNNVVRQRADLVGQYLLFSGISRKDCEAIVTLAREVKIARGKTIFFEGDLVQQVMLLTAGSVKLFQLGAQGTEVILRVVGPGDVLCLKCFPEQSHCATAIAVEHSAALVWEARQFETVKRRFPALERNVTSVILETLNELEVRFREVSTENVAPRLSGQLLRLIEHVGKPVDGCFEIVLSQKDLAQLVGTTLFTVSRLLAQWEQRGIVKTRRNGVLLLDLAALRELSSFSKIVSPPLALQSERNQRRDDCGRS